MTKQIRFSFGTITVHRPGFLEGVMDEGIELGAAESAEIVHAMQEDLARPYVILVDRRNRYSLTHAAMLAIAAQANLVAMAVVCYDQISVAVAEMEKLYGIPMEVFTSREDALAWLREKQDQAISAFGGRSAESEASVKV